MGTPSIKGKKILITRPEGQCEEWAGILEKMGAMPVCFPLIEIVPAESTEISDLIFEDLNKFDWIILPSANAVKYFFLKKESRPGDNIRASFAVTGPKTASFLKNYGYEATFIPSEYTGENLAETIPDIAGKNILIAETDISDGGIKRKLESRGANVEEISVYNTRLVENRSKELQEIIDSGLDVVTFASPSAVDAFFNMGIDRKNVLIASIGPVTTKRLLSHVVIPHIEAKEYTIDGLTEAIIKRFE